MDLENNVFSLPVACEWTSYKYLVTLLGSSPPPSPVQRRIYRKGLLQDPVCDAGPGGRGRACGRVETKKRKLQKVGNTERTMKNKKRKEKKEGKKKEKWKKREEIEVPSKRKNRKEKVGEVRGEKEEIRGTGVIPGTGTDV